MKKFFHFFNAISGFFAFFLLGFLAVRYFRKNYSSSWLKNSRDHGAVFNSRQKKILRLFWQTPELEMKDLLSKIKNVTERTLRRDLLLLQQKGLVEKVGNTKSVKYIYHK